MSRGVNELGISVYKTGTSRLRVTRSSLKLEKLNKQTIRRNWRGVTKKRKKGKIEKSFCLTYYAGDGGGGGRAVPDLTDRM